MNLTISCATRDSQMLTGFFKSVWKNFVVILLHGQF